MLSLQSDQELDRIASRLADSDALGLVLVEAEPLGRIERRYGSRAYEVALDGLVKLIRDTAVETVPADHVGMILERGGDTILLFCFRPRNDQAFYQEGLHALARRISDNLTKQGKFAVYPYHRDALILGVGSAVALYNPNVKSDRQILQAVREARRDAELELSLLSRRCNRQLLEVILSGQIEIRYEPIVDIRTREVLGYEALARGPRNTELYSPEQLFGMAERMDLTFELDCLCRRAALEQARCVPPGRTLFLNCLPTAIGDPNLRDSGLRQTLEKCGLQPGQLVIEISERESIDNFAIFRELRDEYQELGVRIAVDDAGAGYASLEAVMEIAPDFLKADMGLVRGIDSDPPRQEVMRGLAGLARRIGAQVIAEGVETPEELRTLRELSIPYAQGFVFGPALTGADAPLPDAKEGSAADAPRAR